MAVMSDSPFAARRLILRLRPRMAVYNSYSQCNFPKSTLNALLKRMRTGWRPVGDAVREVKRTEMVGLLDDVAWRSLKNIDDLTLGGASARDSAVIAGIAIDKSLLLKGEPTQIMGHEERKKLEELAPALLAEIKRRGLTIPAVQTRYSTES